MVSRDLYGGSYRYFKELERQNSSRFHYFDDFDSLKKQLNQKIDAVFLETPTNPLMQEVSIADTAELADQNGALLIVDNTFSYSIETTAIKKRGQISWFTQERNF